MTSPELKQSVKEEVEQKNEDIQDFSEQSIVYPKIADELGHKMKHFEAKSKALQIKLEIAQKQLSDYQAMKGKLEIKELKLKKLQKQNAKLREKYNYKLWNSVDLVDWIMSLENGRYKKYEK